MRIRAGNEMIRAIVEITPGGELDEAMLPPGTRLMLKSENPYNLPRNHPKRVAIEQEGKTLFISLSDGYSIPMVNAIGKWESGVYVSADNLHVIQFREGEFFADDEVKYKTSYGQLTELEFLREHLKRLNLRQGEPPPYVEATREWFDEQDGVPKLAPTDHTQTLSALTNMDPHEIRAYFTPDEIGRLKLQKATKDRLIVAFLQEGKSLSSEPIIDKE